jgi:hypothetical protein
VRFFVTVVVHVLAIDGHRRSGRFGRGTMPFVVGAADKRDERKRGNAGEDQIFYHISVLKLAPLARTANGCAPVECRRGYGAGVVVVVVFLTTTLVATILSPSCV